MSSVKGISHLKNSVQDYVHNRHAIDQRWMSTTALNEESTYRFQQLIGIRRWAIELGRADILTEVSCLSQHLAEPREGHLVVVYRIFKYLSLRLKNSKDKIVLMVSLCL